MTDLRVLGRATTHGQALPLGVEDPVVAARAVRRALADAGRRAVDVSALIVAATGPLEAEVLAAFARRALGPHGASVRCSSQVAAPRVDASELAASAAAGMSGDLSPDGIGIAVALGPDGTTVALCLGRALMARGADPPPGAA